MAEVVKHRPGIFKQSNKAHKTGRHRSKALIHKDTKGRSAVTVITRRHRAAVDRLQRHNQAKYLRKLKREEVLKEKRSRGSAGTPPFLVAVIALSEDVDSHAVVEVIKSCDGAEVFNADSLCHLQLPRFRQRFDFICPAYGDICSLLDVAKVADCMLLAMSASTRDIDSYADHSLSCLLSQGLPACVVCVQGVKSLSVKKQSDVRRDCMKRLEKWFADCKLHSIDSSQDAAVLLRSIAGQKLNKILLREYRPHLLASSVTYEPNSADQPDGVGTLKVSGYVRGQSLSANCLVHVPGCGDFQLVQIDSASEPFPDTRPKTANAGKRSIAPMDSEVTGDGSAVLERCSPELQASLDSEAVVDPMNAEQTWPTEDELKMAEAELQAKRRIVKRVPKGTSEYQAAWIIDSEEEEERSESDDDDDNDNDGDEEMVDAEAAGSDKVSTRSDADSNDDDDNDEEKESIVMGAADDKYDNTVDMLEESEMLKKYRAAHTELMFPDEVETPMDVPACIRFQKYRGLKSFRTSPWDPFEELPVDYGRIFRFENFARTRKRLISETVKNDYIAKPGIYVTLHIANVPVAVFESHRSGRPVVVFGLLPHEQKMSVVHFLIKRFRGDDDEPVKSKERLTFHVGYRRFTACPIYSQHTNMNKHKFERFLPPDATVVASVYAPIMFPPAGVLMFKQTMDGSEELVAVGRLLSVDPDRIIAKRIVLSGHPFKINKKHAVVRYMFFDREDILWFKPVELRTKWGRHGNIKEPLGTHGHMKCIFDGQLKSQDTVLMNLYKRVYPKWTYNGQCLVNSRPTSSLQIDDEMFG